MSEIEGEMSEENEIWGEIRCNPCEEMIKGLGLFLVCLC